MEKVSRNPLWEVPEAVVISMLLTALMTSGGTGTGTTGPISIERLIPPSMVSKFAGPWKGQS